MDLNPLEIRLIFLVASNMPCHAMPCHAIHGPAVNVPLISHLCVPFCQGFHLKPRLSLRSWRGSCVTRDKRHDMTWHDMTCTSTLDQQRYLQLYSDWNWTIHYNYKDVEINQWLGQRCCRGWHWGTVSRALPTTIIITKNNHLNIIAIYKWWALAYYVCMWL